MPDFPTSNFSVASSDTRQPVTIQTESNAAHTRTRCTARAPHLIGLGLLASALFSSTFVLNRTMSLHGGPWVWSATLRYIETSLLLMLWLLLTKGRAYLRRLGRLFVRRLGFWLGAGGVGYGMFYACCCFAADHAPGWIVAATWQGTIIATPLVLRVFGETVPLRGLVFLMLIFMGIMGLNINRLMDGVSLEQVLAGVIPLSIAAFCYPMGNQLLNRLRHNTAPLYSILEDPVAAVLLMTLGALPFLIGLTLIIHPPSPDVGQIATAGMIALVAGCLATPLFIHARNTSSSPYLIAAVDATQAGEVAFTLMGESLLTGDLSLGLADYVGLAAVMGGLAGFALSEESAASDIKHDSGDDSLSASPQGQDT
ncbi:multidrug resistance efflux transporter family protein [Acetobacter fabarum]|uniref:multidrug resistance efflux transporter family protein n=3 Tax=Acetobacter fabarum TaxID=483199 RepID=UPI001404C1D7|nr:multidrug resistance efflux transporter family protein [Acetobacter fabarum]NHO43185.1 multidrug resistance efflux transporter family protein [Acetobacter fabarum]